MFILRTIVPVLFHVHRLRHFSFSTFLMCTMTKIFIMGRKRNQGKARKAAKAKAREEAEENGRNNNSQSTTSGPVVQSLLSAQRQQLQAGGVYTKCKHGLFDPPVPIDIFSLPSFQFVTLFNESLGEADEKGGLSFSDCLIAAKNATWDQYADVWKDSMKLEMAISVCLCVGTDAILGNRGSCNSAIIFAAYARFFEQYIAVEVKHTQALYNWPKIGETYNADLHTLVKFFRHRNFCSCLDEKYEEVKHVAKMGRCFNPQCSIPNGDVERSKAKYCSRCRNATYCSRECQEAHWSKHKCYCDNGAARIARFEAKQKM